MPGPVLTDATSTSPRCADKLSADDLLLVVLAAAAGVHPLCVDGQFHEMRVGSRNARASDPIPLKALFRSRRPNLYVTPEEHQVASVGLDHRVWMAGSIGGIAAILST